MKLRTLALGLALAGTEENPSPWERVVTIEHNALEHAVASFQTFDPVLPNRVGTWAHSWLRPPLHPYWHSTS